MSDTAAFGAWLRSRREFAGLSQEELATRAGLSIRAVSNLERGRTGYPHPGSLQRLADALALQDPARAEFLTLGRRRPEATAITAMAEGLVRQAGGAPIVPQQLPAPVRQFVGRQNELAALAGLLDSCGSTPPAMAIAVIGGTAGVGKTALVVQWAHQVAGDFPDGQLYVNLQGYDRGRPVPPGDALAGFLRALGVAGKDIPADADECAALYRSLLAGRRILVVLDNACQAGQVRPLLPGSPTCVTVVTSRDALAGLVAGDGAVRLEVDLLPLGDAIGVLRGLIGRRIDDDPAAAATLARQCCRLPLALRVAAERAAGRPEVPLAGLAAELADLRHRLDVLETGGDERTAVRAVFFWSYRHLDSGTARAFRLAGLHPGPDLDAYATAALTGATFPQAARQLVQLARAHLIQPASPDRYSQHDLLRGYARELASTCDGENEERAALTRLLDYYQHAATSAMDAAFPAERHRRPLIPPQPATPVPAFTGTPAALTWLGAELPALVAATAYATAGHGWPGHATRLAATLFRYLDTSGHFPEAITIHTHALRAARRTGDPAAEAAALIGLGLVHGHQGRHPRATRCFRQALAQYRRAGDQGGQARALNYLGLIHCQQGHYPQATSDFQQSAAVYRTAGERTGEAYALSNLGVIALRQGRYQQATGHQQQALALLGAMRDRHGQATVLERLGLLALQQGHYQQATSQLQQAFTRYRDIGDQQGVASTRARLGLVSLRQEEYQHATHQFQQALTVYRQIGDPSGQATALNGLGDVLLATGRPANARIHHAAAARLAVQACDAYEQARAQRGLASAWQASGDPCQAHRHRQQALTLYTFLGAPEAGQIRAQLTAGGPAHHRAACTCQDRD